MGLPDIIPVPRLGTMNVASVAWLGESDKVCKVVPSMLVTFDCSTTLGEEIFEASAMISTPSSFVFNC